MKVSQSEQEGACCHGVSGLIVRGGRHVLSTTSLKRHWRVFALLNLNKFIFIFNILNYLIIHRCSLTCTSITHCHCQQKSLHVVNVIIHIVYCLIMYLFILHMFKPESYVHTDLASEADSLI